MTRLLLAFAVLLVPAAVFAAHGAQDAPTTDDSPAAATAASAGAPFVEPDPLTAAAVAFLAALEEDERGALQFAFDDAERHHWQPVPMGDAGVRIDALDEEEGDLFRALLESVLSEDGLNTVDGVIVLEGILVALEEAQGRPSPYHGPGRYFITVYGEPGGGQPWAWRLEGHHLSMTFTCHDGADGRPAWTAHGPWFVGAQPAHVMQEPHRGFRLLGEHDDAVRALVESLTDEQRAAAVSAGPIPGNVLLVPGEDSGFDDPGGLSVAQMDGVQQGLVMDALRHWANWLREDLSAAELARMEAGLDGMHLVWIGGDHVHGAHYWRIVGPHFALEYAAPERDPDHVHALWRDTDRDFGGDLLRRHLEEHHGADGRGADGDH